MLSEKRSSERGQSLPAPLRGKSAPDFATWFLGVLYLEPELSGIGIYMSRIGVIADIHGHLAGLKKALEILEKERVDRLVVCGDVVGYGTSPNECCDRVRALNCPVTAGNHDWAVAGLTEYKETHLIKAI